MALTNLSNYTLSELKGLENEIEREIQDRQQQEVKKAREQILAIAKNLGMEVDELVGNDRGKSKVGSESKVPPRYQNPADCSQNWSGRGRQPKWVVEALASGKKLDDLKI
jgi:DNA-binding protein H-NS